MELVDLKIYKQYMELIYYTNQILMKYPKSERYSLVNDIKLTTYNGMKKIIDAYKIYDRKEKLMVLNELDGELKFLKVIIRVSYKNKYITSNNYGAWSRKITNIGNMLGAWINSCLKQ